jgi:hypothetical protein
MKFREQKIKTINNQFYKQIVSFTTPETESVKWNHFEWQVNTLLNMFVPRIKCLFDQTVDLICKWSLSVLNCILLVVIFVESIFNILHNLAEKLNKKTSFECETRWMWIEFQKGLLKIYRKQLICKYLNGYFFSSMASCIPNWNFVFQKSGL